MGIKTNMQIRHSRHAISFCRKFFMEDSLHIHAVKAPSCLDLQWNIYLLYVALYNASTGITAHLDRYLGSIE